MKVLTITSRCVIIEMQKELTLINGYGGQKYESYRRRIGCLSGRTDETKTQSKIDELGIFPKING